MQKIFGVVVIALMALAPSSVIGQKKADANKKGTDISDATPQQYALLGQYREMTGTLVSVTPTSIVVRIEYNHPVEGANAANSTPKNKPNANNKKANNPAQEFRQQLQKMQRAQANAKMEKDYVDFELPFIEKVAIRRLNLGVEYDDKGNVKEQKPADARGTAGLPGFAAKVDDLNKGDQIKIYLSPAKSEAAAAKKDEFGALPANRPQVRMVMLIAESSGTAIMNNRKKK